LTEFCAHAHYMLLQEDIIGLYPLVGLTVKNYIDIDTNPFDFLACLRLGLAFGGGMKLQISDTFAGFGEIRYTTGQYHQGTLTVGVLYSPDPDEVRRKREKKREDEEEDAKKDKKKRSKLK